MQSAAVDLARVMQHECEVLAEFHLAETSMRAHVLEKDWNGLDSIIGEMTRLADELVEVEESREAAVGELRNLAGVAEEATFYQVVSRLPKDERDLLAELYRKMKFSVLGIRSLSLGIDEEARTMNSAVSDILGELYPHRKGRMYTKTGASRPNGSNPLLLDREL